MLTLFVAMLIEQMGDNSFHKREKAHKIIKQMAHLIPNQLEKATKHSDLEIAVRARQTYQPLFESICWKKAQSFRTPWLFIDGYFNDEVRRYVHQGLPFIIFFPSTSFEYLKYRIATKFYVYQLLLDKMPDDSINVLLDRMEEEEKEWKRLNPRRR